MEVLQRPGGELATRPIHFFWVVDCSGSMYGEKIGIVNNTIQECIPEMRSAADNNPNAQLLIRALQFSSGASWITSSPVPVEDYGWEDMDANGLTELGKAFDLLAAQLSIPPMPERALPPVIVLLSDGQPTDDYKKSMDKLKKLPWFRKAVKIAISIDFTIPDRRGRSQNLRFIPPHRRTCISNPIPLYPYLSRYNLYIFVH